MSTDIVESKPAAQAEIRFSVTEETIKPMLAKCMGLKIDGINDKVGIAKVKEARSAVRTARTTIDKERLAAGEEYRLIVKGINETAKRITEMLAPAEEYLVKQIDAVEAEIQRIEDEKLDARLKDRLDDLDEIGGIPEYIGKQVPMSVVRNMTIERFTAFVKEVAETNAHIAAEARKRAEADEANKAEAARLAEEKAALKAKKDADDEARRVEEKRIADERAAAQKVIDDNNAAQQKILDDQRAELQKEADRIAAENKRIADEAEAKTRLEWEERDRAEQEKQRVANLPHKEKIIAYRDALLNVSWEPFGVDLSSVEDQMQRVRLGIRLRLTEIAESL